MYEPSETGHDRSNRTNYEIHRRTIAGWEFWAIRGRVEEAIQEAKRVLGQSGTEAVRVVCDLYDPATKMSKPNTVFRAAVPAAEASVGRVWPWRRLLRPRVEPAAAPGARRRQLTTSLAAGLIVVGLGTAISWLRS